jgi:apolipoprotein N-acyltransferase
MAQAFPLVCIAVGAALLGIVTRGAIPPLTWVALAALLHGFRSIDTPWGSVYLGVALYVALAIGNRGIIPVPGPAYFLINAAITTTVVLPFLLDRVAARTLGPLTSTLIFPLAWVTLEFLRSRLTPSTTWGSIAYTQYGVLPLMQLAAFVGIWGITFVIAWSAATLDLLWSRGWEWSLVRLPVLACASVLVAIALGGSFRLVWAPTDRASTRVATLNRPADLFVKGEMTRVTEGRVSAEDRPQFERKLAKLQDWFLDGSRREARAGARVIVWPEGSLLVFSDEEAAFLGRAARVASDEHVHLAMGMGTIHLGARLPFENKLVLIDPAGRVIVSYLKSHPVTGWEAGIMIRGDGRVPVVATGNGRVATAICFDADFPEYIRQAAQGSADVLLLPVNDWETIKELHFQMHAFRAIEAGIPIVRAAASGLSSAFDPWGRVLGLSDYFAPGDRTLTVQVPFGGIRTVYGRIGDLFAWLCVAGLVLALAVSAVQYMRGTSAAHATSSGSTETSHVSA